MPLPPSPARPLTLFLATALAAAGLAGCSALSPFHTCDDSAARLKGLRSQSILDSVPDGTTTPEGFDRVDSRCVDDTGDAWLYASRVYRFPGSRQHVVDFYRATAGADGWELQHDPYDRSTPESTAGLCFTRGGDGEALLLTVQFLMGDDLRFDYGQDAGPQFDSGAGFEIEVGSETDGAPTGCFD
ncbi:hypothetical protein ACIQ9R_04305 [Streptomyces sp. NPDC094447]|uniref:hypothetical protein n=1 Tax=unclassified Streptomyces TaxID=2593676 RepID=UPI003720E548